MFFTRYPIIFFLFGILLLLACSPRLSSKNSESSKNFEKVTKQRLTQEAYAVYSEALKAYAAREKVLTVSIVRFTILRAGEEEGCLDRAYDSKPWQSAIKDFRRKNTSAYTIEPKFDVPFKYELADEMEEIGGARVPPPGQSMIDFMNEQIAKLEKRERDHFTQVQLSAPGISDDGQIAVVYIEISYAGEFRVLRKKENTWTVDPNPLCDWIS